MKKILLALLAVCLCSCLWAQEITESYGTFTVTGKNYPEPLKIVQNDDKQLSEYIKYKTRAYL